MVMQSGLHIQKTKKHQKIERIEHQPANNFFSYQKQN